MHGKFRSSGHGGETAVLLLFALSFRGGSYVFCKGDMSQSTHHKHKTQGRVSSVTNAPVLIQVTCRASPRKVRIARRLQSRSACPQRSSLRRWHTTRTPRARRACAQTTPPPWRTTRMRTARSCAARGLLRSVGRVRLCSPLCSCRRGRRTARRAGAATGHVVRGPPPCSLLHAQKTRHPAPLAPRTPAVFSAAVALTWPEVKSTAESPWLRGSAPTHVWVHE
jgi:hypothetical protein